MGYLPQYESDHDQKVTIEAQSGVEGYGTEPNFVLPQTLYEYDGDAVPPEPATLAQAGAVGEEWDIPAGLVEVEANALVTGAPKTFSNWGIRVKASYYFDSYSEPWRPVGTNCRGRIIVENLTTNVKQVFYTTTTNSTGATITAIIDIPRTTFEPNTLYKLTWQADVYGGSYPTGLPLTDTRGEDLNGYFYLWADRTPDQPTITAPPNGGQVIWGEVDPEDSVFELTWTRSDPDDGGLGGDAGGYEVQYRPVPTALDPNPAWVASPESGTATISNSDKYLRRLIGGADGALALAQASDHVWFFAGPSDRHDELSPREGRVQLPSPGIWQFRVRTFDKNAKVVGISDDVYHPTPSDLYTHSPWSNVSQVNVVAPFLPPTLMAPINNVAQETDQVTFEWQFRDPRVTGGSQYARQVRIRQVDEVNWTELIPVPPPALVASDTFTRANSTTTLGTAETGGAWSTTSGTWGINTNQAYVVTGVASNYSLSSLLSTADATVEVTITTMAADGFSGLRVRTLGSLSGFAVFRDRMWNVTNGVGVGPVFSQTFVSGDRMRVVLQGSSITVYRQAGAAGAWVEVMDTTSSDFLTNTRHGINIYGTAATTARFDNFSIYAPEPGGEVSASEEYVWTNGVGFTLVPGFQYEWQANTVSTPGNHNAEWTSEVASFWAIPAPGSGAVIPVPDLTVPDPGLGCGDNRVFVYARGGVSRLGEITNMVQVRWERQRDDISEASVIVRGWSEDCGELLATLRCWQMELVIFRDNGTGPVRVWEGPITRIAYEKDQVEVAAHDCMAYVYRRVLRIGFNDAYRADGGGLTKVTRRAAWVIQNALSYDDPNMLAYMQVIEHTDDARNSRVVEAYSTTAWQLVDDFAAKSGLDYVTVGRKIILWDTHEAIGRLPEMRDGDFGTPPIVTEYGMQLANFYVVTNNNGVYGTANRYNAITGLPDYYGYIEMLSSAYGESDEAASTEVLTPEARARLEETLAEQAERNISGRYPTPLVARVPDNSTLNPEINVGINQLIPGVHIPLRSDATLRQVTQLQKLDLVTVTQTDKSEQITVTLSPAPVSAEDTDAGEGGEP